MFSGTLMTEAELVFKPASYSTLYICRILLFVDRPRCENRIATRPNRRGILGRLRSRVLPGDVSQPVARINRCSRAVSHESLAKVRLTCRGTRSPLRRVARGRRFRSPVLFRIPRETAGSWRRQLGGSEPRQKCFRLDDKQNEN